MTLDIQYQCITEGNTIYESAEFQDINMITGSESTISPAFIEAVSQSMGFSTSDKDY